MLPAHRNGKHMIERVPHNRIAPLSPFIPSSVRATKNESVQISAYRICRYDVLMACKGITSKEREKYNINSKCMFCKHMNNAPRNRSLYSAIAGVQTVSKAAIDLRRPGQRTYRNNIKYYYIVRNLTTRCEYKLSRFYGTMLQFQLFTSQYEVKRLK